MTTVPRPIPRCGSKASSTRPPAPSPGWCSTRPARRCAIDRQRARLRRQVRPHRTACADALLARVARARRDGAVDPRDAPPRRPPVRRALDQERAGGRVGIGRRITDVQRVFGTAVRRRRRLRAGRPPVRPPVRRRRDLRHRHAAGDRAAHARPYPRLHDLPGARGAAHTRAPSSATRCSCPTTAARAATSPAATRPRCTARSAACWPARRHRAVPVPRLRAGRPRDQLRIHGRGTARAQHPRARRRERGRIRGAAQRPRRDAGQAPAAAARGAGEHARRRAARARGQRRALPQDPARPL